MSAHGSRGRLAALSRSIALVLTTLPAVAAAVEAGPERSPDGVTPGTGGEDAGPVAMAFGQAEALVVFVVGDGVDRRLRGASLGADGAPRAWQTFEVPVPGLDGPPAVASDGAGYLVTWCELEPGSAQAVIRAMRVGPDGSVRDPAPLRLSPAGDMGPPAVAFGGGSYQVVWSEAGRVAGARIPAVAGAPSPGEVLGEGSRPAIAFDGGRFVLAFARPGSWTACVAWLDPGSSAAGAAVPFEAGDLARSLRVAAAGGRALVVWLDPDDTIRGSVVQPDGPPASFHSSPLGYTAAEPAVASDGAGFLVAWTSGGDVRAVQLDGTGAPDGGVARLDATSTREWAPSLVRRPGGWLAAWRRGAGVDRSLPFVTPVLAGGADAGQAPLALAPRAQKDPAIAAGADRYLLAWTDDRGTGPGVRGVLLAADGAALTPGGFPIAPAPGASGRPSVAFDGERFVVAYEAASDPAGDESDVAAVRVTLDGAIVDAPPVPVAVEPGAQLEPVVAAARGETVVAWRHEEVGARGVRAVRIADGRVVDGARLELDPSAASAEPPALGATSQGWLLAARWSGTRDLALARLGPSLAPLDDPPLLLGREADRAGLACSGAGCAAVWCAAGRSRVAMVAVDGALLSLDWAADLVGDCWRRPAMTDDGAHWVVAGDSSDGDGYAATWLARDGSVTGAASIAPGPHAPGGPALASAGGGRTLVAYTRVPAGDPGGSGLLLRAVALSKGLGEPCTNALDCASGSCADGVCCESDCGGDEADCAVCAASAGSPADGRCALAAAGHACRAAAGPCDAPETCDGTSLACAADVLAPAGSDCRPAYGACDRADVCDGVAAACADRIAPDGSACDDADPCTSSDACRSGACTGDWACEGYVLPAPPPAPPPQVEPTGADSGGSPGCGCASDGGSPHSVALLAALAVLLRRGLAPRRRARTSHGETAAKPARRAAPTSRPSPRRARGCSRRRWRRPARRRASGAGRAPPSRRSTAG